MTLNEFIEDAFVTEHEYLIDAISDLTPDEMMWKAGPEANHIGWNEKFGLPTRDNGFEHTQE